VITKILSTQHCVNYSVEQPPSKHEAMSSNPSATKKKKRKKENVYITLSLSICLSKRAFAMLPYLGYCK
jgi:hypothetical protein